MEYSNKLSYYTELLKNTRNIILHGAPGTGKTHLAKEIAKNLGCEDKQIKLVQFHPSYDYTDFVEGLRPVEGINDTVVFERRDGSFKEFCKEALLALNEVKQGDSTINDEEDENVSEKIDNFEKAWQELINSIKSSKETLKIPHLKSGKVFTIDLTKTGSLKILSNKPVGSCTKNRFYRIYCGDVKRQFMNYYNAIIQYMIDNFGLKQVDSVSNKYSDNFEKSENVTKNPHPQPPFVFIIDEINRGEISKIFGELFFAIDPSYRGEKGKVQTQYQNLIEDDNELSSKDEFEDGFFIPENVYIIGTMNDIDRNVESIDLAFRRRFTFVEVKASDTQEAILSTLDASIRQTATKKMNALNDKIRETFGEDYCIGGAYFQKLSNLQNSFDKLWDYHLKPLLREYLRGTDDMKEKLEAFQSSYGSTL